MNGQQPAKKPHGKIRRSQVITTFGPGAMLDLPRHSVLIAGLDSWKFSGDEEIREPRLVEKLKAILGVNHLQLKAPPANVDDPTLPKTGIGVVQFPEWFITAVVPITGQAPTIRSRMLVHRKVLMGKTIYEYRDGPKPLKLSVVPIRFVAPVQTVTSATSIGDFLFTVAIPTVSARYGLMKPAPAPTYQSFSFAVSVVKFPTAA